MSKPAIFQMTIEKAAMIQDVDKMLRDIRTFVSVSHSKEDWLFIYYCERRVVEEKALAGVDYNRLERIWSDTMEAIG